MKHPIGQTRNGVLVHVDLIHSQAAKHIAQQPHLLGLAKEMLGKTIAREAEVSIECNMGRAIGYSLVVGTTEKDTILYGRLLRDDIYTRFVKSGKPTPTQYLTASLRREADGSYELCDIWIGKRNPPRPGSADETADSKPYWSTHAFVFEHQTLQLQTLTKTCPY